MLLEGLVPVADAPIILLSAGLLIGLFHSLEPDHIAAMAALTGGQNQKLKDRHKHLRGASIKGAMHGMLWGFGHTTTIFLILVAVFVLSVNIPPHLFGFFEVIQGMILIVLGAFAILGSGIPIPLRLQFHTHSHLHTHEEGTTHSHLHTHKKKGEHNDDDEHDNDIHQTGKCNQIHHRHGHKSYFIGCIHGLAGSGGLVILMATTFTTNSTQASLLFASVFGIGSIIGMSVATGMLSILFVTCGKTAITKKIIRYGTGTVAIVAGIYFITLAIDTLFEYGIQNIQ